MRWHFLVTPSADGVFNMALDEALMRRAARTGDAVFRVYGWSSPTLSLGRNQLARDRYDDATARALGVSFVRRPTGGRALLHHREITYSATMPAATASVGSARDMYHFINGVLLAGLRRLGVPATRASETTSLPPGVRPCFDVPAEHEIVVGRRKLVGSAQWRHGGALLQHGSILVRDDQTLIGRLMKAPLTAGPGAATLADALGREPPLEELAGMLRVSLQEATAAHLTPLVPEVELDADVAALRLAYSSDAWTWRR
jgi:lipoate-protein ligase A